MVSLLEVVFDELSKNPLFNAEKVGSLTKIKADRGQFRSSSEFQYWSSLRV